MTNLEAYSYTELSLAPQQREVLANCFIGCLSLLVSEDDWHKALKNAASCAQTIRPLDPGVERG